MRAYEKLPYIRCEISKNPEICCRTNVRVILRRKKISDDSTGLGDIVRAFKTTFQPDVPH